ncbi:MAG: DUF4416 family protein [Candidatus Omnitrophota bacterium]|nr:DUF4416 family protein [Candidatus Omnitrophota bacterium]
MGKIAPTKPVKLIVGFIFKDEQAFCRSKFLLIRRFGKIDFESRVIPFTLTEYYQEEFGKDLSRVFVSFSKLIQPREITGIKILTNKIENRLSSKGHRLVNIDPGYLDLAKLILVSTKDYIHRVYLDKGIYAETTLFYRGKSFEAWQWTYPDFRTPEYIEIFNQIRELYAKQIKDK